MLLFSPNWLFLYPGIAMMLAGLTVGGLLLGQPIYIDNIRLGLDTLVYCCTFAIAGFQAILFSLLSRMYAIHEGLYPQTARDRIYGRLLPSSADSSPARESCCSVWLPLCMLCGIGNSTRSAIWIPNESQGSSCHLPWRFR